MALSPEPRRTNRLLLWGVLVAVLVAALLGVRYLTRERLRVRVSPVTYQDLQKTVPTNGKVEFTENSEFQAHAQAPGQVQQIYVEVGDKVKSGDLLVRMDDAEALASVARAKSALSAAQLALADIEKGGTQDERNTFGTDLARLQTQRSQDAADLASVQKLQQKGAASASEVAAAQHKLQSDEEAIRANQGRTTKRYGEGDRAHAQAQLADAQAALKAALAAYSIVSIRSPLAGSVYSISVSQYDYLHAGDELLDVADLKNIQVRAWFDEPDIGQLKAGQPVKIVWDAKPGMTWHGHVVRAPTTVISYHETRNVGECIISVDDAHGDLAPNSDVTVTVTIAEHLHVLSIPHEALHTDGIKNFVYKIVQNKLVRTPVGVGVVSVNRVEITSGLALNDRVADSANNNRELEDGIEIIPIPVP